jgi:tetratricopeptide (TPR) repeat protein
VAIVGLDTKAIARLEEALGRVADAALRSRLQARLAVELYYAPDRARSEALSAEAVAAAEESRDPAARASALGARHVALWRPDRVEERLAVADEMTAAARAAGDRHAELQAQNWRVCDLFELGDMTAWREEVARHARLADELRLPAYQWYTPLWAAVEAVLAGRYDEAERLASEAEDAGRRAGDGNAELFATLVRFGIHIQCDAFDIEADIEFVQDKISNSPAGIAYRGGYSWILAGGGDLERARSELDAVMALPHAFDTNWLSLQAECAETAVLVGDRAHAATLYERLAPYAGRPATAGRAVTNYGAIDRHLGGLAAVLGRNEEAIRHLETAISVNEALGCTVWRAHAQRDLSRIAANDPRAKRTRATRPGAGTADQQPDHRLRHRQR